MQPVQLLLAALAVGTLGGIVGAAVVVAFDDDPAPAVLPAAADATAADVTDTEAPSAFERRVSGAVRAATPAIVTILADGPTGTDAAGDPTQVRSVGTGVVISEAGFVFTAAHVIAGAETVTVVLATGEQRPALPVLDDSPYTDLAVLAIPAEGLRAAVWGDDTALSVGAPVVAVSASTFAVGPTVSLGVVAATDRSFPRPGVVLHDLIQVDAAVNGGDSGGALVNLDGEVVGMLTTVVRQQPTGEPVQGVAFAQSASTLRPLVEAAIAGTAVPRPRLGIEVPLVQHVEVLPGDPGSEGGGGARIVAVAPGTPAAAAGVRPGDIVRAVNGVAVDLQRTMVNLLGALRPGVMIELAVERDGQIEPITLPGFRE